MWSPEECEAYDALCAEAWASSETTRGRTEAYLAMVDDAVQAHEFFARDVEADFRQRGASAQLKAWRKRQQTVVVSYEGKLLTKPRTIGTRRTDADGRTYATQELFDFNTWDEIEAKVREYIKQAQAYSVNIAIGTRLLELRDAAPGAATPAEAVVQLGTTIEAWLGDDEAA